MGSRPSSQPETLSGMSHLALGTRSVVVSFSRETTFKLLFFSYFPLVPIVEAKFLKCIK